VRHDRKKDETDQGRLRGLVAEEMTLEEAIRYHEEEAERNE